MPLPQVRRRYADAPHGQVHLRLAGSGGVPLVCLHPSPLSSQVFATFQPVMAADRLVVAVDTPGYGQSDPLPGPASIAGYAAALWPALDAVLPAGAVDLFGYHTGSAVALELALARPERVRRIVCNSALMFSPAERSEFAASFRSREGLSAEARAAAMPQAFAGWRKLWRDVPDDATGWPLWLATQQRFAGGYDGFYAAFTHDFAAAFDRVRQPILVLNPSDDLHEITLRLIPHLRAGASIHPLPGWTHGFLDAHPDAVAGVLRGFLDAA